jgi:LSD1 subclass zinc finger protein
MNIELKCHGCESLLKVDTVHAGKQARCPSCQTVNSIPQADDGIDMGQSSGQRTEHENPFGVEPSRPLPPSESANPYRPVQGIAGTPSGASTELGLIFGIVSLGLIFFGSIFCCIFPVVGVVLGGVGLIISVQSDSQYRTVAIVLNSISIVSFLIALICFVLFLFIASSSVPI